MLAHQMVKGRVMIPVHWGTFDLALHGWTEPPERIAAAAERAGVQIAIPRPGQSIDPSNPPALARWWPETPWQTADVAPVMSSGLPEALQARIRAVAGLAVAPGLLPETVAAR